VGHGLANMQARAEGLGGVFSVKSVRNEGTSITLRAPI
jgi:signal transduction histidine kinase